MGSSVDAAVNLELRANCRANAAPVPSSTPTPIVMQTGYARLACQAVGDRFPGLRGKRIIERCFGDMIDVVAQGFEADT